MIITPFGSNAGIPTKHRNVSGAALSLPNSKKWFLVDCGEGTQHQITKSHLSIANLEAIFITHVHGDHCFGLPGLLASLSMHKRQSPLTIVAPAAIEPMLTLIFDTSDTFLSYELNFVPIYAGTQTFHDVAVTTIELSHRVPCFGYKFAFAPQSPTLNVERLKQDNIDQTLWHQISKDASLNLKNGKLGEDYYLKPAAEKAVIISGDNDNIDLLTPYLENVMMVVHEATYTQAVSDKVGNIPRHSSAKDVCNWAQTHKVPQLMLTHFSSRYQKPEAFDLLIDEAKRHYSGKLHFAKDLDPVAVCG